jgi:hypothetical protein
MSDVRDVQERAIRATMREERAKDAARALQEHEAERQAAIAKTARLRALRIAKQADAQQQPPKRGKVKKAAG